MNRTRRVWRCRTFLAALGGLILLTSGTDALAGKGPAHPTRSSTSPDCRLSPSPRLSPKNEFASCLSVSAALARVPAVGQTAKLTITVRSDVNRQGTVSVKLPANLAFASAPGAQLSMARAQGGGIAPRAAFARPFAAGGEQTVTMTVRALSSGSGDISARATAPAPYGVDGGADSLPITVGETAALSHAGMAVRTTVGTVRAVGAARAKPATSRAYKRAPVAHPPTQLKAHLAPNATVCAVGSWFYVDQNGVTRPSINFQVQVWDRDTNVLAGSDDLLATGVTGSDGSYSVCADNSGGADEVFDGGTADLYVRFVSENSLWRVRDTPGGNNDYAFATGVVNNVGAGNVSFGGLQPGDSTVMRALHAFDAVNSAFFFIPSSCWDPGESPCRQVVVNWTSTSTDGTFYSTGGNDVHLAAADPDSATVVIHETGHAIMDDNYNDAFPPTACGSPHFIQSSYDTGCAWTEGFADWFPMAVLNDNSFRWPDGSVLNLEDPTWGSSGWANGDTVEGRIAGSLLDIADFTNEPYWDRYGEGDPGNIWTTFTGHVNNNLASFWSSRAGDGFNVAASGALASVYQNTIDYGFRDPLANGAELIRPTPTPHNYSFNSSSAFWSVVAVRPPAGVDDDLALYDDFGQTTSLGSSAFGGNAIDFIAIDSNRRSVGDDYYPRVNQFSGTGNYTIEWAQGSTTLSSGSATAAMGANDVVNVRDTFLSAGTPVYIKLVPSNGTQDGELLLMGDDPASSATWVRPRSSAVALSSSTGAGGSEQIVYTPAFTEWHGLVVLNKSGSGTYTVFEDTTAPSASVSINGGAAFAKSTAATLSLASSDAETGVTEMRISTDGSMDSEPYVPFSASAPVTLPAGDGTKTVLVQFRNGAGQPSSVASDTIVLDATAPTGNVMTQPATAFQTAQTFPLTWTATDGAGSGVANYTVRVQSAGTSGGFGAFTNVIAGTALTTTNFTGTAGRTYCFSVKAVDNAGNASIFGAAKCTAIPIDDASLTVGTGWTRFTGQTGYYLNTFTRATANGSQISSASVTAKRVSVIATKCPTCGTIDIRWKGASIGTANLNAASVKKRQIIPVLLPSVQTGILAVRVTSAGLKVEVDGFGFSRK